MDISIHISKGLFWIRFNGEGFCVKNIKKHSLLFSERQRIVKGISIGNYFICRIGDVKFPIGGVINHDENRDEFVVSSNQLSKAHFEKLLTSPPKANWSMPFKEKVVDNWVKILHKNILNHNLKIAIEIEDYKEAAKIKKLLDELD